MKEIYKDYLFEKHILVSEGMTEEKYVFETLFAMAHFFGVKITKGKELVRCGMVKELSKIPVPLSPIQFTYSLIHAKFIL